MADNTAAAQRHGSAPTVNSELNLAAKAQGWEFHIAVFLALVTALVARLSFLGEPFQNDAGIYIYMGKLLWNGGRLYQDFWETKFPSVALLTAPLYVVFSNHWWPYVLTQAGLGIAAAWSLAVAAKRFIGGYAYAPVLLFGLVGFNLSRLNMTGFQLETIELFFETIAACFILRALCDQDLLPLFYGGLLAGIAALSKPTGLAVAGAAALCIIALMPKLGAKPVITRLAILAAGAMIPVLATVAWVMTMPWKTEMPGLLREVSLYASGTPWRSLLQFKTWVFFLLPVLPLLIRGAIEAAKPGIVPADSASSIKAKPAMIFAGIWFMLEVAAVIVQKRLYAYHFLVLMPPAALLFGLSVRSLRLGPTVIAVLPLAIVSLIFAVPGYLALRAPQPSAASRYVIAHTYPGDYVWADPEARLLLETDRRPGSRLQMTFYFVNHDKAPAQFSRILLDDFDARQPKYIVLPIAWAKGMTQVAENTPGLRYNPKRKAAYLAAWQNLDSYIHTRYRLETTIDGSQIFHRIEPAG